LLLRAFAHAQVKFCALTLLILISLSFKNPQPCPAHALLLEMFWTHFRSLTGRAERRQAYFPAGGFVMKNFLLLFAVILALALVGQPLTTANGGVSPLHKEQAIVEFKTPVKLMHVILEGEYLFVHDEDKMQAGEACTYVYKSEGGIPGKLVISFHCIPVPRETVARFTARTSLVLTKPVIYELTEFQFAGSHEGHQVPTRPEAINATVDVMACCQ
jgi:hypothetical protein